MPFESFGISDDDIYYDDEFIDFEPPHRDISRDWIPEALPVRASSSFGDGPSNKTTPLMERQLLQDIEIARKDIVRIDEDIAKLHRLKAVREHDIRTSETQLEILRGRSGKGVIDEVGYESRNFDWDDRLVACMRKVFKIENFRFCQRGVCNAVLDKRDVFCVMPTGGGKSLTYQLPALLQSGCTLVISPLLALISDQVYHLRSSGIEAIRITSGTPDQERKDLFRRLYDLANGTVGEDEKEIKLCYVTPEMLLRSGKFKSMLVKLNDRGKLDRIVIDEAHCVSEMGHDFRKDYHELCVLRKFYPEVPILALSATCPPLVLGDVLDILGLRSMIHISDPERTLYFSSPLYRKNLHYSVLPKPEDTKGSVKEMAEYILENHPDESGIIYCLRQKDTETVAQELASVSDGRIKTGVYHAGRNDSHKERLHEEWRNGTIKVVCATIAFGLGIDKADVRFVLHHSMSKSIESYYQESGRAGRDGKDSDCVLYYRPQDCTSLFAISASQKDGRDKVLSMIRFCENMAECRKLLFSNYFSVASQLDKKSWTTEEVDASAQCGHCDNCTRDAREEEDVTQDAWKIVKTASVTTRPLSLKQLAMFARGLGGKTVKENVDLKPILGTPIRLKALESEHLIVHLMTERYLTERLDPNEHTVNVYIIPGPLASRLLNTPRDTLPNDKLSIKFAFMKSAAPRRIRGKGGANPSKEKEQGKGNGTGSSTVKSQRKRKRVITETPSDDEAVNETDVEVISDREIEEIERHLVANSSGHTNMEISDDEEDEDVIRYQSYKWSHSMWKPPPMRKRRCLIPQDEVLIVPDSEGEDFAPVYISSD